MYFVENVCQRNKNLRQKITQAPEKRAEKIVVTLFQQFLLQNLMNMCTTNEVA